MRWPAWTMALLLLASSAQGQESGRWSSRYQDTLRRAAVRERMRRRVEIQRSNYAQAEAIRMVSQGLGMLTRPSDPWNRGGRYSVRHVR